MPLSHVSTSWIKFHELIAELARQSWNVTDREVCIVAGGDQYGGGSGTRYVKKVVVADGGVCFVADNSVVADTEHEKRDETSFAAFSAVEAVKALPFIYDELAATRAMLTSLLPGLSGTAQSDVQDLLRNGGYAAVFDARGKTL